MFYAEIKRPIHLSGKQQELCVELNEKFGVTPGYRLVEDGVIKGEKGEARYWDYISVLGKLPTFECYWNCDSTLQRSGYNRFITVDLFLENGLLLQSDLTMEVHEINALSNKEGGAHLLLCSIENTYFQVIAY